jgi:hypothetical protein
MSAALSWLARDSMKGPLRPIMVQCWTVSVAQTSLAEPLDWAVGDRGRLATLVLCLVLVLAWIGWGSFRGHEQRCFYAVTVGQHQTGYQEVPCNASPQEQFQYLRDHPDDFHPGTPASN